MTITLICKTFLSISYTSKNTLLLLFSRHLKKKHAVIIVKEFVAVANCSGERSKIPVPIKYD